ncbi:MAG: 4Fe-4S dicluster domain-containing protein [Clostridium sp.]|jgi:Fe-S-cluster-containing hydrogenase component 2|uniref:ATP-binding protein n=1 Tax=Clostridium sp. TaxID=1506 RepID=UPI0025C5BD1C|nr:4Fe-4S dicluster domain-containing protein [Clostridium sp.]MCH3963166.1 4Fe-4S dicluster domain-containing protein [Clostridium sp.]MCI1716371.1 4Fe-4S dicluster domain-containing protein [Clostridium sp.]MCI1800711.1 4Fe-4S dicluster domain-containing protein [Clostridium sp.]MCI1814634.1 4Fe-4S dicluster domain-containing protein [Clostridium sp.]MCI1871544.1 4Fe-4S dicluster domain-containing protein [Clostridium sp.]
MIRKIVNINKEKCNGCGLCVNACHEGAIKIVDGKAELISDEYCDGLGDCLPECPTGAINIVERESKPYDEEMVISTKKEKLPCGCPGTAARKINRKTGVNLKADNKIDNGVNDVENNVSELQQWPVQLKLINTKAPYLKNADLLVAADCTAYAYGGFHKDFIKGRITVIGCPKLDDISYYEDKLAEIISNNDLKSITVVRMEVPCCRGIVSAVKNAMLKSQTIIPYREVVVSTDGNIIS